MEAALRLDHLTKRFGHQFALRDVSLEVPRGTVFALLGENGAGKTTAIRIMLGLTAANAGSAEVLGLPSRREGLAIRRQVGYVSEQPTLYDWMTVGEIGWFAAGFYPDGFLTRYGRLTEQYGLAPKRKIKALSKGMRAKVALSLALAHDPELLILDEPTSGLDALVRREFLESMVDRAAEGKTIFLSSHQIADVERVADIVAIVRQGKLLLVERLDELKAGVAELTITLDESAASDDQSNGQIDLTELLGRIPGRILGSRHHARQCQALVRDLGPDGPSLLQALPEVRSVEVRTPSLEEIFVAYMRSDVAPDEEEPTP